MSTVKLHLKRAIPPHVWRSLRAIWTFPRYLRNQRLLAEQQRAITGFRSRLVRHTYGGFELCVQLSDPVAEAWYDRDWIECPEIAFLGKHKLRSGCRVFDIGAHQCVVALMLARIVGPSGFVLAVEANPHNARAGEKNREINNTRQLKILHAAIAARVGRLIMSELLNSAVDEGTSGLGRIEVPALSIDDLTRVYGAPDVLYVDVEGFEHEAMRGARETLKTRPDCFVEMHVQGGLEAYGGSVDSVISFLPESEYRLFMASEEQREFVPFARNSPLTRKRFFLIAVGRAAEENGDSHEKVKKRP